MKSVFYNERLERVETKSFVQYIANPEYRNLPSGYTQVKYLESSGTQYIDTGFTPNSNTGVDVEFKINNTGVNTYMFGENSGSWSTKAYGLMVYNNYFYHYANTDTRINIMPNTTSIYKYVRTANNNFILYENDVSIGSGMISPNVYSADYTLYLFSVNWGGRGDNRMYMYGIIDYFKIYDNGTLVRDLVPCYNSNNVAGMYDLVNNVFYPNAGTGTFIVGEDVPQFIRVEEKGWKLYEYNKVGGKIFYIDETSSGGEYVFYDQNGNVMSDIQVGDTPYKYKVIGTPNKPKYYVFNESGTQTSTGPWNYKDSNDQWVYNLIGTTDGIGTGKTNTALVMTADNGAYANYNGSMWNALKTLNTNKLGGCSDWFISSMAELGILRTATDREGNALTTLFSNTYIWSSFEYSAIYAWHWDYRGQNWHNNTKYFRYALIPIRSF